MEKIIKSLRVLDYSVSVVTLGYGLYVQNPWIVGVGLGGLLLAKLNIADKLSKTLKRKFAKRQPVRPVALQDDTVIVVAAPHLPAAAQLSLYSGRVRLTNGTQLVSASPHSLLKSKESLNHVQGTPFAF